MVCRDFLAPKKIDPRLLDPKFAFKELDDVEAQDPDQMDGKKLKAIQGAALNDLLHPEKRKRHRDGYQDGDYTLYHTTPVHEFIESSEFLSILSTKNALVFNADNEMDAKVSKTSLTTDEIKDFISDLKVLGKKEFKAVIKWRDGCRALLGLKKKIVVEEKKEQDDEDKEVDVEEMLERRKLELAKSIRKEKKKSRERKLKVVQRLRLGMETPFDVGVEASSQGVVGLPEYDMGLSSDEDEEEVVVRKRQESDDGQSDEESDEEEEEDETAAKVARLDAQLDEMFTQYEAHRTLKNPARVKLAKTKSDAKAAFEEWYGIAGDTVQEEEGSAAAAAKSRFDSSSDDSSSSDEDEQDENEKEEGVEEECEPLSKKARLFFDNPIFEESNLDTAATKPSSTWQTNGYSSSEDEAAKPMTKREKKAAAYKKMRNGGGGGNDDDDDMETGGRGGGEKKGFEVVPAQQVKAIPGPLDQDDEDEDDVNAPGMYYLYFEDFCIDFFV